MNPKLKVVPGEIDLPQQCYLLWAHDEAGDVAGV